MAQHSGSRCSNTGAQSEPPTHTQAHTTHTQQTRPPLPAIKNNVSQTWQGTCQPQALQQTVLLGGCMQRPRTCCQRATARTTASPLSPPRSWCTGNVPPPPRRTCSVPPPPSPCNAPPPPRPLPTYRTCSVPPPGRVYVCDSLPSSSSSSLPAHARLSLTLIMSQGSWGHHWKSTTFCMHVHAQAEGGEGMFRTKAFQAASQ